VPAVYRSIARWPAGSALVLYPAFEPGLFNASQYLFYQRSFKKPMLNGALGNSDGEALRRTVYNPFNPQVPGILSRYGFSRIVYLGKLFEQYEGTEPEGVEVGHLPAGFKLEKRFPSGEPFADAYVFRIEAPRSPVVPIYGGDITVPHLDNGRITARLLDRDGIIRLTSYAKETVRVRVRIPLTNLRYAHRVVISQVGRILWLGEFRGNESGQATVQVDVPPGGTQFRIEAEGRQWRLDPKEKFVFGAGTATMRLGDVVLEYL
jgi:hypothetical protein